MQFHTRLPCVFNDKTVVDGCGSAQPDNIPSRCGVLPEDTIADGSIHDKGTRRKAALVGIYKGVNQCAATEIDQPAKRPRPLGIVDDHIPGHASIGSFPKIYAGYIQRGLLADAIANGEAFDEIIGSADADTRVNSTAFDDGDGRAVHAANADVGNGEINRRASIIHPVGDEQCVPRLKHGCGLNHVRGGLFPVFVGVQTQPVRRNIVRRRVALHAADGDQVGFDNLPGRDSARSEIVANR